MAHPIPGPLHDASRGLAAIGEPNRLAMVSLLARRPHYGEELAEVLGVHPATISHHVRRLREAGLVRIERHPPYALVSLDVDAWLSLLHGLGDPSTLADAFGLPSEAELSSRILHRWLGPQGRLTRLPSAARDRRVVLRHIAAQFETGRIYPEREMRRILLQFSDDPGALEAALLELGWLRRGSGVVRRVSELGE